MSPIKAQGSRGSSASLAAPALVGARGATSTVVSPEPATVSATQRMGLTGAATATSTTGPGPGDTDDVVGALARARRENATLRKKLELHRQRTANLNSRVARLEQELGQAQGQLQAALEAQAAASAVEAGGGLWDWQYGWEGHHHGATQAGPGSETDSQPLREPPEQAVHYYEDPPVAGPDPDPVLGAHVVVAGVGVWEDAQPLTQ